MATEAAAAAMEMEMEMVMAMIAMGRSSQLALPKTILPLGVSP